MAISVNTPRIFEQVGRQNNLPVKASTEIFLGSLVGMTSGYARGLVAADIFGGFADQHVNNTVATDAAATIRVIQEGYVQVAITSAAVTEINKAVYASDNGTFTYTSSSNTLIGRVVRFVSTGIVIIYFNVTAQAAS